jgi:putative MFS transporter
MTLSASAIRQRRSAAAFWLGCAAVTAGVVLHLPMVWMARHSGFVLADMPMDSGMLWGMALIVGGIALTGYGLLPDRAARSGGDIEEIAPPEDAPLTSAHWQVAALLAVALVVDVMKPASLGFVTPGMRAEYHLDNTLVAWLPFAALAGTVVGSFLWGALADLYGRRASILLSSVMFIGTSICGAMPSFAWNVGMCFLMGAAAGGMLPVTYALLAEIMPTRHRGWSLVLIGGTGAIGGFFAASACSALLQPLFGWRVMWFLNMPTGLLLIALSPFLPESARFLQQMGRMDEARTSLARFGVFAGAVRRELVTPLAPARARLLDSHYFGLTSALTLAALTWGLINFGLLLWLPSALVAEGRSVGASSALIARSTLIAAPVILVSTWLYSRWSTRGAVLVMLFITGLGLIGLALREAAANAGSPLLPLVCLIVGSVGVIALLFPYTAEQFPLRIRGRATGWVAGCSKLGGLAAQLASVAGMVPSIGNTALAIAVPTVLSLLLIARNGRETRGVDLRDIEVAQSAS